MQYSITEEQLSRLADLNSADRDELVAKIRTQILVPVERMRKAFEENYVKTQDELQKELLKHANEE